MITTRAKIGHLTPSSWFRLTKSLIRRPSPISQPVLRNGTVSTRTPAVDEIEGKDALRVHAELPGVDPHNDLEITVQEGVLAIRGERRGHGAEEQGSPRIESWRGTFERRIPLPEDARIDEIQATYRLGIVQVMVPRGAQAMVPRAAREPPERVKVPLRAGIVRVEQISEPVGTSENAGGEAELAYSDWRDMLLMEATYVGAEAAMSATAQDQPRRQKARRSR